MQEKGTVSFSPRRKILNQQLQRLLTEISNASAQYSRKVRLLAVSKYFPDEDIACLANLGQLEFAESRPQSLRDRAEKYPDLRWHMIGPLQRNKAKYIGQYAACWHSVEDVEVAKVVAKYVCNRRLPVLLQVNIAGLEHQHGVLPASLPVLYDQVRSIPELEVTGLMCMAPRDESARLCFRQLCSLRDGLSDGSLGDLSMGMSNDFHVAIEEGSTIVRLGSILFDPEGINQR